MSIDVTPEFDPIPAYADAWRNVLDCKRVFTEKSHGINGDRAASILSLLPLRDDKDAKNEEAAQPEKEDFASKLAQPVAAYLADSTVGQLSPQEVQIILYPQDKSDVLFPHVDPRADGFTLRRGGYPALFVAAETHEEHSKVNLLTLGDKLAQVIFTHIMRSCGEGPLTPSENQLLEGLYQILGADFATHALGKQVNPIDYDAMLKRTYQSADLGKILSTRSYDEPLTSVERALTEYYFKGSFIQHLVKKYGMETVLNYFVADVRKRQKEHTSFAHRLGGIVETDEGTPVHMTMSLRFEPEPAAITDRPELGELLTMLGCDPSHIPPISSESRPMDSRIESALAIPLIEQFYQWEQSSKTNQAATPMTAPEKPKPEPQEPMFMVEFANSFDMQLARNIFGPTFTPRWELNAWRQHIEAFAA